MIPYLRPLLVLMVLTIGFFAVVWAHAPAEACYGQRCEVQQ